MCFTGEAQARGNACGFSNSLFCTGSGKSVDISSAGLVRAKTLLGLEEDNDHSNFQGFQHPTNVYTANKQLGWKNLSHLEMKGGMKNSRIMDHATSVPRLSKTGMVGSELMNEVNPNLLQSEIQNSDPKPPPIKFHTAGGRSLSVSSEALKRARSLLGDPDLGTFLNGGDAVDSAFSVFQDSRFNDASSNKEKDFYSAFTHPGAAKSKHISKTFISPLKSTLNQVKSTFNSENITSGSNLIKKFDAVEDDSIRGFNSNTSYIQKPLGNSPHEPGTAVDNSLANGIGSRINPLARSSREPLVDISNTYGPALTNNRQANSKKKRLRRRTSISPFKRPRSSKFTTPLNRNVSFVPSGKFSNAFELTCFFSPLVIKIYFPHSRFMFPSGLSTSSSENFCLRRTVSTRYPFQIRRTYIKEYFGVPSLDKRMVCGLLIPLFTF